jgi:hypothetical protein
MAVVFCPDNSLLILKVNDFLPLKTAAKIRNFDLPTKFSVIKTCFLA